MELFYCLICNKTTENSKFASYRHLKKYHNITTKIYYDDYIKSDNEGICLTCNGHTKYRNFYYGYYIHCSKSCSANDSNTQNKRRETNLERYDVEHALNNNEIKSKQENTNLERYGFKTSSSSKEIKLKIKNTVRNRYGVDFISQSEIVKEKVKRTNKQKYDNEVFTKSENYINIMEKISYRVPRELKFEYMQYDKIVRAETKKWKKELFSRWDGICYYTGNVLVIDSKDYNNPMYRVIDHKISISCGFKNNINPLIIGNIDNLCICSRFINSRKNYRTEEELKIWNNKILGEKS